MEVYINLESARRLKPLWNYPLVQNYVVPGSCSENRCGGCIRGVPDATSDVVSQLRLG